MTPAEHFAAAAQNSDDVRLAFLTGTREQARRMGLWPCYRCHRAFAHGRHLAGHLVDFHGEAR